MLLGLDYPLEHQYLVSDFVYVVTEITFEVRFILFGKLNTTSVILSLQSSDFIYIYICMYMNVCPYMYMYISY